MKRFHDTQPLIAEINITPFTDVILVLLIIFIVATPLISQSNINIKLPEATSKNTFGDTKSTYAITVTGEGMIYFENKIVTNNELKQRIDALISKNPGLKIVLAADQACRFKDIVKTIDILTEAGVKSLNIATKTAER